MHNSKRMKREEGFEFKPTRTLLVSGISGVEENGEIMEMLGKFGPIKETYTIQNSPNVIFVMYHDVRDSEKAFKAMNEMGKNVIHTISKYEIPRDVDRCDETMNQGTILLVTRDVQEITNEEVEEMFSKFGDIKCVRNYKHNQRFIEFYDGRSAIAAYKVLHETKYKGGTLITRFVWDITNKQRCMMIRETDAILRSVNLPQKKPTDATDEQKTRAADEKIYDKNVFLRALDDLIVENLDDVERFMV